MNRWMILLLTVLMVPAMMPAAPLSSDQLVLLPVKNDPTISFRIWFRVGSQDDPPGKEGLALVTASMLMDASTKKNTYEQILDRLFPLAASYSATCSAEMTVIQGRVHRDNLGEYYPLLLDAILQPAFKQEDLERIKKEGEKSRKIPAYLSTHPSLESRIARLKALATQSERPSTKLAQGSDWQYTRKICERESPPPFSQDKTSDFLHPE